MNLQQKIKHYFNQFIIKKRLDGSSCYVLKPRDKKLMDAIYKAHNERLPDDRIYEWFYNIFDALQQYDINKINDIEDNRNEIIDNIIDVYTTDLTEWLNSDNRNVYFLSEAIDEGAQDGFQALAMAQGKAIERVFDEIINLLI